jgi:hypothetical protein
MNGGADFASRTWSVGRYECTLVVPRPRLGQVLHVLLEWSPRRPRSLTDAELAAYRRGRNEALAEISAQFGLNAGVIEL